MIASLNFLFLLLAFPVGLQALRIAREKKQNRIALVIRGEAFRSGGKQHTRKNCLLLDKQLACSQDQVKFIVDPLRQAGVAVDVFLSTYHTNDEKDAALLNLWKNTGDAFVFAGWCDQENATQQTCMHKAFTGLHSHMESTNTTYDLIIHTRHDLVPKNEMIAQSALEHINDEKVWLVPFQLTHKGRFFKNRVPDTVQVFTPNVFSHMKKLATQRWWIQEGIWNAMEPHVGKDHMGFMTNYFADSNPAKAMNPMYRFCARKEGPIVDQWIKKEQEKFARLKDPETLATVDFASAPVEFASERNLEQDTPGCQ